MSKLNEGLLMSYPLDRVEDSIKKRFPEVDEIERSDYNIYTGQEVQDSELSSFVAICHQLPNMEEFEKVMGDLYGWNVTCVAVTSTLDDESAKMFIRNFNNTGEYICPSSIKSVPDEELCEYVYSYGDFIDTINIFLEAKFNGANGNIDQFENLYHITLRRNVPHIQRQGLTPKNLMNHKECVYFDDDLERIFDMLAPRDDDRSHYAILKLDLKNHHNEIAKYNFQPDPRSEVSVMTYDTVSPEYLLILDNGDWKPLTEIDAEDYREIGPYTASK